MRHISLRQSLLAMSLLGAALSISHVNAQESAGSTASAPAQLPKPGSTMQAVKEKFGSPSQEAPAVGIPPITRWDYPGYAVFFEHDRVLHTVIK
jgi:hypothetical protein